MINTKYAIQVTGNIELGQKYKLSGNVICSQINVATYSGPYEVTPTKSTQTLDTIYRHMTSNVTVNPIPDLYVDTTISEYGAGAGQILNGYKGYVNGNLVTGTAVLATATVSGTTLILTDGFPVEVV